MRGLFLFIGIILVLAAVAIGVGDATDKPRPNFDHSYCQYPNRESNPPNGCNNTDYACPEVSVKSGKEECD